LHFSQKVAIFAPKRVIFLLFVPTLFFSGLSVLSPQTSPKISGQASLYQPWLSPYCLFKDQLEINLAAMPRGFESHRLRQVSLFNFTLGSDFLLLVCKISLLFL